MAAMNQHERAAWRALVGMGASEIALGNGPALDLRTCRPRASKMALFTDSVVNVVGRSGANRWHVDRGGRCVFVVTDDPDV